MSSLFFKDLPVSAHINALAISGMITTCSFLVVITTGLGSISLYCAYVRVAHVHCYKITLLSALVSFTNLLSAQIARSLCVFGKQQNYYRQRRHNANTTMESIAMTTIDEPLEAKDKRSALPLSHTCQQPTTEGLCKMGKAGLDDHELQWDIHMALATFLGVFIEQPGWYYPILTRVGGCKNDNLYLPDAMGWKEGFTMKIFELAGLATFCQPHGWQIKKDEWDEF
jgi:hypothetical protein